jgi:hypothetical protein
MKLRVRPSTKKNRNPRLAKYGRLYGGYKPLFKENGKWKSAAPLQKKKMRVYSSWTKKWTFTRKKASSLTVNFIYAGNTHTEAIGLKAKLK